MTLKRTAVEAVAREIRTKRYRSCDVSDVALVEFVLNSYSERTRGSRQRRQRKELPSAEEVRGDERIKGQS